MQESNQLERYFFIKHKTKIVIILGTVATLLGLIGFYLEGKNAIIHTLGLFVFEWTDFEQHPFILSLATILATLTTSFGLFTILFSKHFNAWHIKSIQKNPYNLLIGLSEQNISLLENSYSGKPTIIIEKNKDHPLVEYFKERGFGVKTLDANKVIDTLDLTHVERIIISTSNDRKNIALGKGLLKRIKHDKKQSIYVSINNRDLSVLFKQNIISSDQNNNTSVAAFSLYENMAKRLFLEHPILGNQPKIIQSNEPFNMIVVGDSDLALEIVYHIAFLSTLPHENPLTLYLIDTYASKFKSKIKKNFPNIELIPHLNIQSINVDRETLAFYRNHVWQTNNLTNIYIATQNEEENLEIAINLQDTTYIREIGHQRFQSKVLFALYHNLGLGEEINKNQEAFANFYTFGNISETSTREILFDEELDFIAKLIHLDYRGEKEVNQEEIHNNWLETSPHKRDANKTQAMHIDIKLLAFGLKRIKSPHKSLHELLTINDQCFKSQLSHPDLIEKEIQHYTIEYFPKDFNQRPIDRVARSEHNRWCAFHYLNGWIHNQQRNDNAKEHPCLLPLEQFEENIKETYQYDLASVYYLPKYLARAGFEIVES